MEIGTKLKLLREQHHFNQEHVANELGISQSTYFKLEAGQTRLTIDRAKQLAKLYDIDVEYFFSSDAKAIYCNNGNGNYSNNISGTFEKYQNGSNEEGYKEIINILREELALCRKEREDFKELIEKLLNNYLK